MSNRDDDVFKRVSELCQQARKLLGDNASMRLRVALEIAEIECAVYIRNAADTKTDDSDNDRS